MEAGWSAKKISVNLGLSYSWTKELVRELKAGKSPERKLGSGRPLKTSLREDRYLVHRSKLERPRDEDWPRTSDLADELRDHSGTTVSGRTVLRCLRKANLSKAVKTRKPFIIDIRLCS